MSQQKAGENENTVSPSSENVGDRHPVLPVPAVPDDRLIQDFDTPRAGGQNNDVALAEWSHLQAIILNYSDIFYRIRSWLLTILTGVTIAYYTEAVVFNRLELFWITTTFIALFYFLESIQRVVMKRAVNRTAHLESLLRRKRAYDGPRISLSLKKTENFSVLWSGLLEELRNTLVWLPYFAMASVMALVIFAKS